MKKEQAFDMRRNFKRNKIHENRSQASKMQLEKTY